MGWEWKNESNERIKKQDILGVKSAGDNYM